MQSGAPIELKSLAPRYVPERHDLYVQALVQAIGGATMRNIALTGAYGTGKSSVVAALEKRYGDRLLVLSLSTVGTDTLSTADAPNPAAATTTNRIQQEMVKQILYRDAPARMRGSRFRRIARFQLRREAPLAVTLGLLLSAVLFLSGWTGALADVIPGPKGRLADHAAVLVLTSIVALAVRWWLHDRLVVEKFNAGPATVSLAAQSPTYFDQYMDEIVYYFEQSGRDIVVFEDIDRFDDVQIFETLRALNTLLNNAEQIRKRRRRRRPQRGALPPVLFIYALRDSIFERLGADPGADHPTSTDAAEEEVRRANRTKFFDLVVPVVPFITHRNARDVMSQEFEGTGVSQDLIALAAGHVADKRLIIDLRNEYAVYARRLLDTPRRMPGFGPDKLLALLLYKSVHMADFEAIRLGRSALDRLHTAWRAIVDTCATDAVARDRSASDRMTAEGAADARAVALGERLEQIGGAMLGTNHYGRNLTVTVNNAGFGGEEFRTRKFWKALTDHGGSIRLTRGGSLAFDCSIEQIEILLGTAFGTDEWAKVDAREQQTVQRQARADMAFLRHHTWREIYERPDLAGHAGGDERESFAEVMTRLIRSRLARELIAHGYIDDYFALYVSEYYGAHLRLDALNFVVHALDQGRPDTSYPLEAEDVAVILRDQGDGVLADRAAYNTSILDHLLATGDARAHMMVKLMSAWTKTDREFTAQYLIAGAHQRPLVGLLAPLLPQVVTYLVTEAPVLDEARPALVDTALSRLGDDVEHVHGEDLRGFALRSYVHFPSLTTEEDEVHTTRTVDELAAAGVELPDVDHLNTSARRMVRQSGAYRVTEHNLRILSGSPTIALDDLQDAAEVVYEKVLTRLEEYFSAVDRSPAGQVTVRRCDRFVPVLHEVAEAVDQAPEPLAHLVRLSADTCRVDELTAAPRNAWPALCDHRRAPSSATNLLTYLAEHDTLDGHVAALLGDELEIIGADGVDEVSRQRLAVALVNARQTIPSAQQRVSLAASLGCTEPLDLAQLESEPGELVALLLNTDLVADNAALFASPLITDWPTRESAISRSTAFAHFFSPTVLPAADLERLFTSLKVPVATKDAVLAGITAFAADVDASGHRASIHFALMRRAQLDLEQITMLRQGQIAVEEVVALLAAATQLPDDDLRSMLRSLGGDYALVADPGGFRRLLPDDAAHRVVLDRLVGAGVVRRYEPDKGRVRVHLNRPRR